ncbi:MAG: hypothetical protein AAGA75_26530 [Cyanobacteria bacterium P01_E01_bin.6]
MDCGAKVEEETGLTDFQVNTLLTVTELFMNQDDDSILHTINIIYRCTVHDRSQPLFSNDPEVGAKGIQWLAIQSLRQHECSSRCWSALESAGLLNQQSK